MDAANIKYHQAGDYLLPNLKAPDNPNIGIWGMRRKEHLQKFKDPVFTGLFLSGKLNSHLEETDIAANELFERLIKEYAEADGITEELKAQNQMEWIRRMNGIRARVEETIYSEYIYK
ncbi:MAG: TnpV protein [Oscillospiraceae bacterium]|nr:TnpV protein [Oscillospiraceae bacterium]